MSASGEFALKTMTIDQTFKHRARLAFHCLGLSCLGGAIFLQILVFTGILQQGYFRAAEGNSVVLGLEVVLTAFACVYFVYVYQRLLRLVK
jgi:hypothetical protein